MNNLVLLDGNKISGGINYNTPECYSTEEREVGCWIDGKPLYAKTIDFGSLPNNATKNVAHNISNIEKIVFIDGFGDRTVSNVYDCIPLPFAHRNQTSYNIQLSATYTDVTIITASDQSNRSAYVTIYYTKTTDTAGSGVWTPSGIPAVHYSTEEHIVGTWIDGSTLYEKTIEVNSDGNNRWTQVFNDQTANIVSFEGYVLYANGEYGSSSYYADSNTYCRSLVYDSRHKLQVYPVNTITASSKIFMTVRYTKAS